MRTDEDCGLDFRSKGPYWHIYTPGDLTEIIFTSSEDFILGMNLMAVCLAAFPSLRIVTFTLMNNHFHIILAGSREDALSFFALYRKRLKRFLAGQGRYPDLSALVPDAYEIPDLQALRNEIVYVNRNGYVVQPEHTPYSYPWSAGVYYFNPLLAGVPRIPLSSLSQPEQRKLYHGRLIELPKEYEVTGQMIHPLSFCSIQEGEACYRNAHQYFRLLSRNQETGSGIAKRLADTAFLTDEEMFGVARTLAAQEYGVRSLASLPPEAKNALARKLHFDYKATPRQIRRLLKLDPAVLEALFPASYRKGVPCSAQSPNR